MRPQRWRMLLLLAFVATPTVHADGLDGGALQLWRRPDANRVLDGGVVAARRWPSDFGILGGRCDTAVLGRIVGGGGSVGRSRAGDNVVAVLMGTLRAPSANGPAGQSIDNVDRGCIGHTLELAPSFLSVRWVNTSSRANFVVTPMRAMTRDGLSCRQFSGQMTLAGQARLLHGTACRTGDGRWQIG